MKGDGDGRGRAAAGRASRALSSSYERAEGARGGEGKREGAKGGEERPGTSPGGPQMLPPPSPATLRRRHADQNRRSRGYRSRRRGSERACGLTLGRVETTLSTQSCCQLGALRRTRGAPGHARSAPTGRWSLGCASLGIRCGCADPASAQTGIGRRHSTPEKNTCGATCEHPHGDGGPGRASWVS